MIYWRINRYNVDSVSLMMLCIFVEVEVKV